MAISKNNLITQVRRRLGEPMVKVEVCDEQIRDNIEYARKKYIKWAVGNATFETYFTVRLEAGKRFYDLPAGVVSVVSYDDSNSAYGGINTLFTVENYLYAQGTLNFLGTPFSLIDYHITLDFLDTLDRYNVSKYNYKYHKNTNQLEINPVPEAGNISVRDKVVNGSVVQEVIDSPGWVLVKAYMVEGSTIPTNIGRDWENVIREKRDVTENRLLLSDEIENKQLALDHYPTIESSKVRLYVNGELKKYGVDYVLNEDNKKILKWGGYSLDPIEGDEIKIEYSIIFKSIYYDDSWEIVDTELVNEKRSLSQTQVGQSKIYLQDKIYEENVIVFINDDVKMKDVDWKIGHDKRTIIWKDMSLDGTLTTDDVIEVKYIRVVSVDSTNSLEKEKMSFLLEYKENIENRKLQNDELTNKTLQLEVPVLSRYDVELYVNGDKKELGVDYTILSDLQTISWNGYTLDSGGLNINDPFVIKYKRNETEAIDVEEEIYDNDWFMDYVTALTKINLGYIRRKYSGFQSLGNTGIELDGDSLISEGKEEKTELEENLRNEEPYEGFPIIMG